MIPTLAQVCSLPSPFDRDLEDYAAGHCDSVEVWFTKLEQYLVGHDVSDVERLMDKTGVRLPVASYHGGLFAAEPARRGEAWELLARRLDLCSRLGVEVVVVACDVAGPLTQDVLHRVHTSLSDLARRAEGAGVRAALEFQARSVWGNNLRTAAALVDETASPHLGLCLDTYHFGVGPSKLADLDCLHAGNLFHVQVCDVADVARELCSDSDRILPGEGEIGLAEIIDRLRAIDYRGCVSLELMNPRIWPIPARQFGEIGITALRVLLGQAEGSAPG